jgi:hypothetical protein
MKPLIMQFPSTSCVFISRLSENSPHHRLTNNTVNSKGDSVFHAFRVPTHIGLSQSYVLAGIVMKERNSIGFTSFSLQVTEPNDMLSVVNGSLNFRFLVGKVRCHLIVRLIRNILC